MPPNDNPTVDWLVESFGPVRAFKMCMQLGGRRHYVPRSLKRTGRGLLSRTVTKEELCAFIELWGGENIKFPLGRRLCVEVLHWVYRARSSDIVRLLHISDDAIFKLTKQPPAWLTRRVVADQINVHTFAKRRSEIRERLGLSEPNVRRSQS